MVLILAKGKVVLACLYDFNKNQNTFTLYVAVFLLDYVRPERNEKNVKEK